MCFFGAFFQRNIANSFGAKKLKAKIVRSSSMDSKSEDRISKVLRVRISMQSEDRLHR